MINAAPVDSLAANQAEYKVVIPSQNPSEAPLLVNSKQARRMIQLRKKRHQRTLYMLENGYKVRDLFLKGSHFTLAKKKDKVRSRVALAR